MEILFATLVVGMCFTAILSSIQSSTQANEYSTDYTQAVFLIQQIRELTLNLPFRDPDPGDAGKPPGGDGTDPQTFIDDLDDLMGQTYCPPISSTPRSASNSLGTVLTDPKLANWSQTITMSWRSPTNLTTVMQNGTTDVIYVEVEAKKAGQSILKMGWIVTNNQ